MLAGRPFLGCVGLVGREVVCRRQVEEDRTGKREDLVGEVLV